MILFFVPFLYWLAGALPEESRPPGGGRNEYKFGQAWVWQYQNDWIPAGEVGHRGEMTVYHDTLTRTWLFNREAYGSSGKGFEFILASYEGQYTFCFRDEKGNKRRTVRSVPEVLSSRNDDALVKEEFETYNKETGRTRVFGVNTPGHPGITGKEFVLSHLHTNVKTTRCLADSKNDFQPVVYFNFIEGEVRLPVHFPSDIPLGKVLLEDSTTYEDGKRIILRLKEISGAGYQVDLSAYK